MSEKKLVAINMIIRTCNLPCSRLMSYHIATELQVTDRIFELTSIDAPVITVRNVVAAR